MFVKSEPGFALVREAKSLIDEPGELVCMFEGD